ncbi:MAG: hypothetical protein OEX04_12265 [Acidimicrobiia bacterium]|nr:hypothetical protein [Acidimicrobiia bacterium]MDH4308241.1 hypothetical protein [Acidimicrobiia bacterium]
MPLDTPTDTSDLFSVTDDLERAERALEWISGMKPCDVPVDLQGDELGLAVVEEVSLLESTPRGAHTEWVVTDSGVVCFTDRRMVFAGSSEVEFRIDDVDTDETTEVGWVLGVGSRLRPHVLAGPLEQLQVCWLALRDGAEGIDPRQRWRELRAAATARLAGWSSEPERGSVETNGDGEVGAGGSRLPTQDGARWESSDGDGSTADVEPVVELVPPEPESVPANQVPGAEEATPEPPPLVGEVPAPAVASMVSPEPASVDWTSESTEPELVAASEGAGVDRRTARRELESAKARPRIGQHQQAQDSPSAFSGSMKRLAIAGLLVIVAAAVWWFASQSTGPAETAAQAVVGESGRVLAVVAADTVFVEVDGSEVTVRLAGLSLVRSDRAEALATAKTLLDDQTVTLVDEPNGPAGRSWVYVDGILTNVELVARGVVTVDAAGLTMYEELKAAERSAQEAAIGIWGDADSN